MQPSLVKSYSKEEQTTAVNILLLAFSSDPFQRYLMPDPTIYLESSNPRNMSLYQRHGFETVNKFQFGDGPPIHTMFREAK